MSCNTARGFKRENKNGLFDLCQHISPPTHTHNGGENIILYVPGIKRDLRLRHVRQNIKVFVEYFATSEKCWLLLWKVLPIVLFLFISAAFYENVPSNHIFLLKVWRFLWFTFWCNHVWVLSVSLEGSPDGRNQSLLGGGSISDHISPPDIIVVAHEDRVDQYLIQSGNDSFNQSHCFISAPLSAFETALSCRGRGRCLKRLISGLSVKQQIGWRFLRWP